MRYLLFFMTFLLSNQLMAQRTCGTMQHLADHPAHAQSLLQEEQAIQQWIANQPENSASVVTIPVVVHVVYNSAAENISDAQIYSQIDILNNDFRRMNADTVNTPAGFLPVAADCGIEFCMAATDPNGNATTGITRFQTSQTSFSTNDGVKSASTGGVDAWNTSEYLNIWVCDLSGGLLGYAQFPGGSASTDGVVCDYEYFGDTGTATAPYNLGRTATHEVGHYLNLRHIWGDSNCGDDFCSDTPEHSGSNYGCPSYPSTSSCSGNGAYGDMFMNYMDYTDDACMNIFTLDQKARMLATLNTTRSGLINSTACLGTDYGCTDSTAYNYDSTAIYDDGSCCFVSACTDPTAVNYDSTACYDDGSCIAASLGCLDTTAANYDSTANTSTAFGGALNNTIGGGGFFNGNQHLIFDAYKSCKIVAADVYAQTAQAITFELRNNAAQVIDDTTINVVVGQQRLYFDFDVPVGTDHQLGISNSGSDLFRNSSGSAYPYNIANAIEITGSSATQSSYYYFFYNIEVTVPCVGSGLGCTDPLAFNYDTSATVDDGSCCYVSGCTDPAATNYLSSACYDDGSCCYQTNSTTSVSTCESQYQWNGSTYYNTGSYNWMSTNVAGCDSVATLNLTLLPAPTANIAYLSGILLATTSGASPFTYLWSTGATTANLNPSAVGAYWLVVTDANGCSSDTVTYFFEGSAVEDHTSSKWSIYPNPMEDQLTIAVENKEAQWLSVQLTDMLGKTIVLDRQHVKGSYQAVFDLSHLADGMYLLELKGEQTSMQQKLIKQ